MKSVNWGIIGCGDVTEVKSGPAFHKVENSRLVAVMRRNGELAKDYAKRHHVPKWYNDADVLIADPEINAVYIATPPSSHKEYTIKAAKIGKPVYVEKPMATHYNDCLSMIEICQEKKVPLFVAYYRRTLPRFLKIKSLLEENVIGKIRTVNIFFYQSPSQKDLNGEKHWRVNPQIAGGGYFYDLASHMFDLLQYYLGDIEFANGHHSNQMGLYEAEDTVSAIFTFTSGILGTGIWNFCAYDDLDRTEIVGDRGRITYATFANDPIILETKTYRKELSIAHPDHVQQPLIQTVVNDLLGKAKCPSTGITAAKTNRILDLILGKI
jgi:predicted dehydrogenase